ncbi:MAG: response regulator [Gemmatimonadota bacterium]|nr:MAG: response regulator [Gemmatimonadota bacterium]
MHEQGLRVLIVDDEQELVSAIGERLGLRGFRTKGVTSGEAALDYLAEHSCDVVLLDVKMPDLGGLEVLKRIRQLHPDTQVLMLTGHGSRRDAEEGMRLGAYDYLVKPVSIGVLCRLLQDAGSHAKKDHTET